MYAPPPACTHMHAHTQAWTHSHLPGSRTLSLPRPCFSVLFPTEGEDGCGLAGSPLDKKPVDCWLLRNKQSKTVLNATRPFALDLPSGPAGAVAPLLWSPSELRAPVTSAGCQQAAVLAVGYGSASVCLAGPRGSAPSEAPDCPQGPSAPRSPSHPRYLSVFPAAQA